MTAVLLFGLLVAQAVLADQPDAAALERIRKALERPVVFEATRTTKPDARPVFRVTVRARKPDAPLWADWATVPSYIRPSYPLYHNEFLLQMTPQAFRASTMYPNAFAIDVVPIIQALSKRIEASNRRRKEEAARKEVREALADLERARAAVIK